MPPMNFKQLRQHWAFWPSMWGVWCTIWIVIGLSDRLDSSFEGTPLGSYVLGLIWGLVVGLNIHEVMSRHIFKGRRKILESWDELQAAMAKSEADRKKTPGLNRGLMRGDHNWKDRDVN